LLELKNTFSSFKIDRGLYCEKITAQKLIQHSFKLLGHRVRTPYAELDLIFFKNDAVHIVEVKSFDSSWSERALSRRQALRLESARQKLSLELNVDVYLHLAVVDFKNKINFFENVIKDY